MSFQTIDNAIFEAVTSEDVIQKPILEKKYMYVQDNNPSTTYSTSQIQFTTEVLSNNGKYNAFAEGVVLLPIVIKVAGENVHKSDAFLALKNSNLNLLHKLNVEYNNTQVVQGIDNVNQYLIFKQHSEMSSEDEKLNGVFLGYAKDDSSTWGYTNVPSSEGDGLLNNFVSVSQHLEGRISSGSKVQNDGFAKRISYFNSIKGNGRDAILGDITEISGHMNYIENFDADTKYYYYNAYLRLRDLPFFDKLPLIRSGTMRITMTLNNNVSFNVKKAATGVMTITNFVNNTSSTNPLMFASSYKTITLPDGDAIDIANTKDAIVPSGSSVIGDVDGDGKIEETIFSVSLKIGENGGQHKIRQCRLYVPHYVLNPYADTEYLSNKVRVIEYLDLVQYSFNVDSKKEFNQLITNGLSKMRRLIMVGLINSGSGTTGLPAQSSPFTTEPSTTSPFKLNNFNVYIGAIPLYETSTFNYDYEQFLLELNGQQGINSNLTQGLVSSRISLQDFNNNYHYIVVNLDRKLPENENTSQSLSVSGSLSSLKNITFYCFIERYKTISIDVETGAIIA